MFCMLAELLHLTSEHFLLFLCFYVYLHGKKIKKVHVYSSRDTFHQTIQRPDWLGLLKTDNIIT